MNSRAGCRARSEFACNCGIQAAPDTKSSTPASCRRERGARCSLFVRGPADETITFYLEGRPGAKETPFRRIAGKGLTTLVWEDDDLACAITSTLEPKKLEEVGRRIYDALLG